MNAQPATTPPRARLAALAAYGRRAVEFQRRKPWVVDVAIAIAFLISDLVELRFFHFHYRPIGEIASWPALVAIAVFRAGLLTARRRFPLAVAFLISATMVSIPTKGLHLIFVGHASPPGNIAEMTGWWPNAIGYTVVLEGLLAIYTVAALRGRRPAIAAAVWFNVAWAPWLIPQLLVPAPQNYSLWIFISGLSVILGNVRRGVLVALAEIREGNELIDQGRHRAARGAARAERERVSSDLQALVSRNLRRMVEQAGMAREAIASRAGTRSEQEALGAIERTGRLALADARRALGLLRDASTGAPLAPASLESVSAESGLETRPDNGEQTSPARQRRQSPLAHALIPLIILSLLLLDMGFLIPGWPHGPLSQIGHPLDIASLALVVVPLAFRLTFPVTASLVVSLGFALQSTSHHIFGIGALVALLIGVYAAWAERGPQRGWIAALGAAAVLPLGSWWLELMYGFGLVTTYVPFLLGACLLGWQERRLHLARITLDEQAVELRRLSEEDSERARTEERLRLARELHDVTAHSLTVMTIQAGAARTVVAKEPDQAQHALSAIEEAGLEAQLDLDQVFASGGLRPSTSADALPGISALPSLVGEMSKAGLTVDLDTPDGLEAVSPGLDLSLYRVVQEALTNVAKHAGPTRVSVRIRADANEISLVVEDEGPDPAGEASPTAETGGGRGLVGIDERVRAFGGTVDAEPRRDGGFSVRVRVPLVAEPAVAAR